MMNAMLNVEFQMLQNAAQQRPEKTEAGESKFRELMEQRQNADQPTETTVQQPQAQEQMTAPAQENAELTEDPRMQEQMVMAAMAMLQNPVVYTQPEMPVEQQTEMSVELLATAAEGKTAAVETAVLAPELTQQMQSQVQEAKAEIEPMQTNLEVQNAVENEVEAPIKTVEQTIDELQTETGRGQRKSDEPILVDAETEKPVFQNVREIPMKVGEASTMQQTVEAQPVEKQVGDKLVEILDSGENHVEIQLTPENLGRIEVDLTWNEDGTLSVELKAENSLTRSMLEKDTAGLQALLAHTTEREVRLEVQQNQESQQQNFQQDGRGGEQREPQQHQRREEEQQNGQDFLQQLRLGLIPLDLAAS